MSEIIERLATTPRLLVASDFDGTLSTFTENPSNSILNPQARIALRQLSELPCTYVAIISGRSLKDLREKVGQLDNIRLVGSHGYEFDLREVTELTNEQNQLFKKAEIIMAEALASYPGTHLELKPHSVVFHFRGVKGVTSDVIKSLSNKLSELGNGSIQLGKMNLEYSIIEANKGVAINSLREQISPTMTVFIGDDYTDEAAFSKLDSYDISIKVGPEQTNAKCRLKDEQVVTQFLVRLAERRSDWVKNFSAEAIDKHLFISDLRTCALIDSSATVTWLCTPQFDGAPLFGSLVGGPGAGYFKVSASSPAEQQYVGNSLIGKTTFGKISITDFFDCSSGRTYQRSGRSDFVRLIEGSGELSIEFAPKFNFGRIPTRLSRIQTGLRIECGQQRLVLICPAWDWEIARSGIHDLARSTIKLKNACVPLILLIGTGSAPSPAISITKMLSETQRFWDGWLSTLTLPQNYADLVARSAVVLRGLSYAPSGAIVAAATTSLPETIGGHRNWDYRYCWPRDACLAAGALVKLNALGPAMRLLDWVLGITSELEGDQFLAPLYTVTGRAVLDEAEVTEALGYRGSRPVRIGNLATEQLQLDSVGPIAELMWKLVQKGASLTSEHLQLAERLVSLVQSRWKDADNGIWEIRVAQRHYVHSKLMCWYTVRCSIEVAEFLGVTREEWTNLANEIRREIEDKGFNKELNSYVAAYDLHQADAALLWIILSGFHQPNHPRSKGTLNYIKEQLSINGSIYRYRFDDSLQGKEGEFIICRTWLIEALLMSGCTEEAQELFNTMLTRISALGLLSEQWECQSASALGNYPQAYSHAGLINVACAMDLVSR